jgi:hypothetical protein
LSSSWKAVGRLAFEAEHARELAAHEQRHAQLALRAHEPRQRDARARPLARRLPVHCERVEHSPHQARDPDRLARLGHHARDPLADSHLGARAVLRVAARRDRDEHAGLFRGHQDHRLPEAEALLEPAQDRVHERLERVGPVDALGEVLQRADGEDRVRKRAAALGDRARRPFLDRGLHVDHLVDVRGAQLEDALEPAIGRDRLDPQRHPLEERSLGLRVGEAQPQPPALAGVGIGHEHERPRVLGDVALALVEELVRQRDVVGVDVLHVAQVRRVRRAVRGAGEELRRQQPLEAGGE